MIEIMKADEMSIDEWQDEMRRIIQVHVKEISILKEGDIGRLVLKEIHDNLQARLDDSLAVVSDE